MDTQLRNLLYRHPPLYESVYGDRGDAATCLCERTFMRYLGRWPRSLLDVGCGTGRDLGYLSVHCADCVGVDYQDSMISYARQRWPLLDFRVGDMRNVRLGRTFEAVTSFGYAIANVHTNADLSRTFGTFAAHTAPGALLIFDAINALATFDGGTLPRDFAIDTPGLTATGIASYEEDRRRQLVVRRRTWAIEGRPPVEDFARFRTLAPQEIEQYLASCGFETLGISDNAAMLESDLSGSHLIVSARRMGDPVDASDVAQST